MLWKTIWCSLEWVHSGITSLSIILLLGLYLLKRNKSICEHKHLQMSVCNNVTYKDPPTSGWINVVNVNHSILIANERKHNNATCYIVDELWDPHSKWMRPKIKSNIVPILMTCTKRQMYGGKCRLVVLGAERWNWLLRGWWMTVTNDGTGGSMKKMF